MHSRPLAIFGLSLLFLVACASSVKAAAPTAINLSSTSVNDGLSSGAVVGSLSATDADAGENHTFALVAGTGSTDNASFSVADVTATDISQPNVTAGLTGDPSHGFGESFVPTHTGLLKAIEIQTTGSFVSATLKVYDGEGLGGSVLHTQSVTFNGDADETFTLDSDLLVTGGHTYTFFFNSLGSIGNAAVSSGDPYPPGEAYADYYGLPLGGGFDLAFGILLDDWELQTAATFDAIVKDSYDIRLQTTDEALNTFEQTFTITVNHVTPDGTIGWDGGGATTHWDDCDNWIGNVCPTGSDIAYFDGYSTKDALIDSNTSVGGLEIVSGYTGTITQGSGFTFSTGIIDQADGTFAGGDAALSDNGDFTLSGGSFTTTSALTTIDGDFTHTSGGTWDANGGSVHFFGEGTSTMDVDTSETFHDVDIDKGGGGGTLDISSGDSLVTTGTLTLDSGLVTTGTLEAQGDVVVNPVHEGSDTAELLFDGTATTQTFSVTDEGGDNFDGPIVVDKASGTVQLGADLFLDGASSAFTLTSGTFDANGHQLYSITFVPMEIDGGTWDAGSAFIFIGGPFTMNGGTWNGETGAASLTDFDMEGGTWNGDSSNAAFYGDLVLNDGTFSAPDATNAMYVNGNFTYAAAVTFVGNDGLVVFAGSDSTMSVGLGSLVFSNVEFDKSTDEVLEIGGLGFPSVSGTLTFTSGYVRGGDIRLSGDVDVESDFQGGDTLLVIDGGGDEHYTGSGAAAYTGSILVSKTGTLYFDHAASIGAPSGYGLEIDAGTVDTQGYALTFPDVFILSGGELDLGASTMTVTGDLTFSGGVIDPGTSSVVLDGDDQTLSGSPTFHNLSKTATAAHSLTFTNGDTITVNGTLSLHGASSSDRLSLLTDSPGDQVSFSVSGSNSLRYLDVIDNAASRLVHCFPGCNDSGDNDNWSFKAASGSALILPAPSSSSTTDSTPVTPPATTPTATVCQAPVTSNGLPALVKLPDDGDPNTQYDSAVYYVSTDGKRHAFPNQSIFDSWAGTLPALQMVDAVTMASWPLGPNVTYRGGIVLVKIITSPRVYAVGAGGVLRYISSESEAASLYGPDWAKSVRDVPDVFFHNYSLGSTIDAEHTFSPSEEGTNSPAPFTTCSS